MDRQSTRRRNQDRAKVAGGQGYDVQYEKDKLNISVDKLKDAVKSEGNSLKELEKKLKNNLSRSL